LRIRILDAVTRALVALGHLELLGLCAHQCHLFPLQFHLRLEAFCLDTRCQLQPLALESNKLVNHLGCQAVECAGVETTIGFDGRGLHRDLLDLLLRYLTDIGVNVVAARATGDPHPACHAPHDPSQGHHSFQGLAAVSLLHRVDHIVGHELVVRLEWVNEGQFLGVFQHCTLLGTTSGCGTPVAAIGKATRCHQRLYNLELPIRFERVPIFVVFNLVDLDCSPFHTRVIAEGFHDFRQCHTNRCFTLSDLGLQYIIYRNFTVTSRH
jgi:hypothetical protein